MNVTTPYPLELLEDENVSESELSLAFKVEGDKPMDGIMSKF